jgi:hypothetical protein
MPKNQVSDPITDQEIAFARLVLSGTMTDRRAAEAVGLKPGAAAYTKSKPRVRAYMFEHRAAVREQLVQQETEGLRRLNVGREQVLARLWEIANLGPEMTRGSMTGQVKALGMIVAMQCLIPDRLADDRPADFSEKKSAPPPHTGPEIYTAAWLAARRGKTTDPQPDPDLVRDEGGPGVPESGSAPDSAADASPGPGLAFYPTDFTFANRLSPSETTPPAPHPSAFASAPDTRVPFSIKKNPFSRRQ